MVSSGMDPTLSFRGSGLKSGLDLGLLIHTPDPGVASYNDSHHVSHSVYAWSLTHMVAAVQHVSDGGVQERRSTRKVGIHINRSVGIIGDGKTADHTIVRI